MHYPHACCTRPCAWYRAEALEWLERGATREHQVEGYSQHLVDEPYEQFQGRQVHWLRHHASASNNVLASCKSAVSKPSVNQP